MEQRLFITLLFTGVIHLVLSVPRKYYLIQQGETWDNALAYCRANHDDLAVIESDDNMIDLQSEAQMQQFTSSAWIGMYNDINSWRWSLGYEPVGSITMWALHWEQPDNGMGDEVCGGIDEWGWLDASCGLLLPSVCFDDRYSGTDRYISIPTTMTWYDAQQYCRQHHTDLASARNQTEQSIIQGKISRFSWIGLFRDFWKWVDGKNFSTIPWMAGKPNNALGHENCGYLYDGQASSALCTDIRPFFCYSLIKKKRHIKVKLMSSQDLSDPAVQATILEKIKQKLKDQGMAENITAKWREQPDGQVFHKEKKIILL
ncbi:putative C-type lectin domain family 20 member A [Ictalurus punctatus]|uniref:C-type lectin domain family 20 member A n=1 Tax=Ictalurus punctatus TaxID=7998 RepID=A0A2D0S5S7_ICTPU|nr:putative C-type lectin domain family 20 member A [Ictalurus punctatus]XP_017338116.1 putative C-type lectin domain family 20 member A [Ictalurus punctatus]